MFIDLIVVGRLFGFSATTGDRIINSVEYESITIFINNDKTIDLLRILYLNHIDDATEEYRLIRLTLSYEISSL